MSNSNSEEFLIKLIEVLKHHVKEKNRKIIYDAVFSEINVDDMDDMDWSLIFGIDSALDETAVELYPETFSMSSEDEDLDVEASDDLSVVDNIDGDSGDNSEDDEGLWPQDQID